MRLTFTAAHPWPTSGFSRAAGEGASSSTSVRREKSARRRDPDLQEELAAARHGLDAPDRDAARIDAVDPGRLDRGRPRATDEVVAMLLRVSAPRPSPRTTPSSPVRAMRAPAAADASSSSCARDTPRPTVTTRPTRPAGTASGEPGTTPSAEPAPIRAL